MKNNNGFFNFKSRLTIAGFYDIYYKEICIGQARRYSSTLWKASYRKGDITYRCEGKTRTECGEIIIKKLGLVKPMKGAM